MARYVVELTLQEGRVCGKVVQKPRSQNFGPPEIAQVYAAAALLSAQVASGGVDCVETRHGALARVRALQAPERRSRRPVTPLQEHDGAWSTPTWDGP